jgi:geranylgeranyl diphosphate synthase type I
LIAESFRKITEIEQGWHQNILLNLLSGTVKEIVFGQSGDVNSNFLSLGWEEYIKLATAKTSPLICLPIMGMFKCAELEEPYYMNLRKLTDEIGLAYQIVNDLENILVNQSNEIPTDIKFERVNALIVLLKEMSSEKEINFLKKNKSDLKQYLLSSSIADDLIIKIENILQGIKNSLHLMPVSIRPIISSLSEEIEKRSHQFAHAN